MRKLLLLLVMTPSIALCECDDFEHRHRMAGMLGEGGRLEVLQNQEQIIREMRRINRNLEKLAQDTEDRPAFRRRRFEAEDEVLGGRSYLFEDALDEMDGVWDHLEE